MCNSGVFKQHCSLYLAAHIDWFFTLTCAKISQKKYIFQHSKEVKCTNELRIVENASLMYLFLIYAIDPMEPYENAQKSWFIGSL